ncbi:hypothetical protein I6A84_01765 [Frankia sp. CNm7]|uniref:Uncharacterized protein n=1 Tax=Frankia nepalensis TaxID=1836974 RepID=A0A937ULK6_9ACTN|nr:hypothetical protein [Frankia nepalensis]MBL7498155.1 hypothetical protein [Frankia nepalensis]MBL7509327.1 hypothetical protein [Frankia nepalensis]MBL7516885.1 hypothetical protein [Frankia nepalensis]MBL7627944.1 hypothetical protein [Frankia nepalensis]
MGKDLADDAAEGGGPGPSAEDTEQSGRRGSSAGVTATPWTGDDWALVVGSGSDLAELYDQIARLPAGLEFIESFGDVDLVLVYRPAEQAPSRRELLGTLVDQVVEHGGMLVGPTGPDGLSPGERFMTSAERTAFAAGQADALAAMRRALTGMPVLRPGWQGAPVAS